MNNNHKNIIKNKIQILDKISQFIDIQIMNTIIISKVRMKFIF